MGDIAIRVENLSKQYRVAAERYRHNTLRDYCMDGIKSLFRRDGRSRAEPFWALQDVSFEVKQGDIVGVIGRNGAGKSTLLKILSRITEPSSGRAEIYGRVSSLLEVGTGFDNELSGRENIYFSGAILGMKRAEIQRKFEEIVAFAEVEKFIDTPLKRYSSGMYVRLAFAVAGHLEPDILIVDEVLAVGDAAFQKKCLAKMGDVTKQGRTVLFVSHNMGAISALTTRCLWLDSGHLMLDGSVSESVAAYIASSYQEQAFWQTSQMNDKPMQIFSVRMFSESNPHAGHEFDVCSETRINVEYSVRIPVKNAVIAVNIHALDGAHLISLEDIDQNPELLLGRRPATYCASVTLPGSWLNSGSYLLRVDCGILGMKEWDRVERIKFSLVETGDPLTRKHRRGYLLPMLKWDTRLLKCRSL